MDLSGKSNWSLSMNICHVSVKAEATHLQHLNAMQNA
jgi:hypothetical protein